MKINCLLFLLPICGQALAQNDDDKVLIQNLYTACKASSYSAFKSINVGIELFDTRQYKRSLNNFNKALEKDSSCCDAWYLIGYCHQKTGDLAGAIKACDKSLAMNSQNPSALIIKANTVFLQGDTLNAIELFRLAKEINPKTIDGYYGLALMLHLKGQDEEAKRVLDEMDTQKATTSKVRDNKKIKELRNGLE